MAKVIYLLGNTGSGKTELIRRTHETLGGRLAIRAVYFQHNSLFDVERLKAAGIAAELSKEPFRAQLEPGDEREELLFYEFSGRTGYSLPKNKDDCFRVFVFSVAEGDEKPLKYPRLFKEVEMVLLNKVDLLPFTDFSVRRFQKSLRTVNPAAATITLSCRSGVGLDHWRDWVLKLYGYHHLEESGLIPQLNNFPGFSCF
jgi:hydrogenase nickel incorporation protein HypB